MNDGSRSIEITTKKKDDVSFKYTHICMYVYRYMCMIRGATREREKEHTYKGEGGFYCLSGLFY